MEKEETEKQNNNTESDSYYFENKFKINDHIKDLSLKQKEEFKVNYNMIIDSNLATEKEVIDYCEKNGYTFESLNAIIKNKCFYIDNVNDYKKYLNTLSYIKLFKKFN